MESIRERRRPTIIWWWVASLALVIVGVVLIIWGLRGPDVGPSIPGPIGKTSPSGLVAPRSPGSQSRPVDGPSITASFSSLSVPSSYPFFQSEAAPAAQATLASTSLTRITKTPSPSAKVVRKVARSRPIRLSIPIIGLSEKLSELGLNKNGSVQVPTSWTVPGWYRLGPSPGQKGSAVILGHVDSINGPAAFYRLSELRPGNKVSVKLANGKTVKFKVIGLRMYLKTHFPDKLVYDQRSYSGLNLVTCGGVFDSGTHHYLSNLVVFTQLIKS